MKTLLAMAIALALCAGQGFASRDENGKEPHDTGHQHAHETAAAEPAAPLPGLSIYHVESRWSDQAGRAMTLDSLRGRPVVAAMIYASCEQVCPLIVDDMLKLERRLSREARGQVRFLLVSFDPARDSPAALEAYRRKRDLDPSRWTLLTGSPEDVLELAAVLGVRFRAEANGEFSHSNIIHLIDKDGVVRHRQVGLHQSVEPSLVALQAMLK